MLFNRTDIFESIDVHKASASKKCIICYYGDFLIKEFRSQPGVY